MQLDSNKIKQYVWVLGFGIFVTFGVLLRFVNSSVLGIFAISCFLYFYADDFGWADPFTALQLLTWFDGLQDDHKIALLTSMLTIVGFLVAFQIATKNWKDQMAASAALEVSVQIQAFFDEAFSLIIKAKLFADALLESEKVVRENSDPAEVEFRIDYAREKSLEFVEVRARLSEMSIQSHTRFSSRISVLSSYWGVMPDLYASIQALSDIVDRIWFMFPRVAATDPNSLSRFLAQIDVDACQEFVRICDKNSDVISAVTGAISGRLSGDIIRPNLSFLIQFLDMLRFAPDYIGVRQKAKPLYRKYVDRRED